MEAAIREQPGDESRWLVYGDWLQAQADPRGELVAIQAAQREQPDDALLRAEEARIIDRNREELLGPLAKHLDCMHLRWRFGFIQSARVFSNLSLERTDTQVETLLETLFTHPSGQFLQELILGKIELEHLRVEERSGFLDWLVAQRSCPE